MFVSASIFFTFVNAAPQIGLDIILRRASIHNTGHRVKASDSSAIPAAPRTKLVNGCISLPLHNAANWLIKLKKHTHTQASYSSREFNLHFVCMYIYRKLQCFFFLAPCTSYSKRRKQFLPWPLQKQIGWQKRNIHFIL